MQGGVDLFGDLIPVNQIDSKPKTTRPNGYVSQPGTGPEGETCRSCYHRVIVNYHNKNYQKCGLNEARWTHGRGSDILLRSPACRQWKQDK